MRDFILYENDEFIWVAAGYKKVSVRFMDLSYLKAAIRFLEEWAGDRNEDRTFELSILRENLTLQSIIESSASGQLLYY